MIKWRKVFVRVSKKCFSGFELARAQVLCNIIDQLQATAVIPFFFADNLIALDSYTLVLSFMLAERGCSCF